MVDLTAELSELISGFKFGKHDLLERITDLKFRIMDSLLHIENWYDYSDDNPYGDCQELAVKAYRKARSAFPKLDLTFACGYDRRLFIPAVGNHSFLIAGGAYTVELLVDPALKVVDSFIGSGYKVTEMSSQHDLEIRIASGKMPLELTAESMTLLGVDTEHGNLIYYLGRNRMPANDDKLMLVTQMPFPELGMSEKRSWCISGCPVEIRKKAPLFELAYQLEMKARRDLN